MSRIKDAFENKKAFIGFITGGDGGVEKSEEYIDAMIKGGTDLIEIGIPFSDPIAEGVVIQGANIRALNVGTTVDDLFELVRRVRLKSDIPICFMTYLNPVFHYGYENFFGKCSACGIDGIIIPDIPYEEKGEVASVASQFGVDMISLVAPTSKERIAMIAKDAQGFVYVVSSMGVTGVRSEITTDIESIVKLVKDNTDTPVAVGFGINTPEQAASIANYSDGVIVGSAIVRLIERYGTDAAKYIYDYVKSMKDAIK